VIDGGIAVTVIEIRVTAIRLGIEVSEESPVRQVDKRPVAVDSGKSAPSLMWCIDCPERAANNTALCVTVAVMGREDNQMNSCLKISADAEQERLRQAAEDGHTPDMDALALQCDVDEDRQRTLRDAAYEGYVPAMYDYGLCCDDPKQKVHWLKMAAEKGHLRAMFVLSMECDDLSERRRWLQMAAEKGHVPAMYQLGLLGTDLNEKQRWLEEAARNGWQAAMMELAELGY